MRAFWRRDKEENCTERFLRVLRSNDVPVLSESERQELLDQALVGGIPFVDKHEHTQGLILLLEVCTPEALDTFLGHYQGSRPDFGRVLWGVLDRQSGTMRLRVLHRYLRRGALGYMVPKAASLPPELGEHSSVHMHFAGTEDTYVALWEEIGTLSAGQREVFLVLLEDNEPVPGSQGLPTTHELLEMARRI